MQKLLTLAVVFILSVLSMACEGEEPVAKICYVPFGVETYVPMTVANIDSHCSHVGELDTHDREYLGIQSLIQRAKAGSFKDGLVRAKIAVPGSDPIYIDNDGGVKMGASQYHLDASGLSKVKKTLERVTSKK